MRRTRSLLLLAAVLILAAAPAWSAVLSTGVDTSKPIPPAKYHPNGPGCPVLWFAGFDNGEPARYSALGFPVTFTSNPAGPRALRGRSCTVRRRLASTRPMRLRALWYFER